MIVRTGARYVPAREPNGNVELDQNNYASRAASWLPAVHFGTATLVTNGSYIDASGKNVSINRGESHSTIVCVSPAFRLGQSYACLLTRPRRSSRTVAEAFTIQLSHNRLAAVFSQGLAKRPCRHCA